MIASMSGAMLNLVLIMALGRVYEKLAYGLTTWGKLQPSVYIVIEPPLVLSSLFGDALQETETGGGPDLTLYLRLKEVSKPETMPAAGGAPKKLPIQVLSWPKLLSFGVCIHSTLTSSCNV